MRATMALTAMGLVASGCVHAIHRQHDTEVLLSISFTLADYSTFTFLTHPAIAPPLPPKQSLVLSTNGGTGFGIEAAPPGKRQHQVFFLYETRTGPNILTSAGATDRGFVKSTAPPKVNKSGLPCTSVSPFFIEGIGARPSGSLAMRFYDSEGGNTYGVLDAAQHVLYARPVLVVSTKQIEPLWTRGGLYHIWIKSLFFSDAIVLEVLQHEDGSYQSFAFKASTERGGGVSNLMAKAGQQARWSFYVIADPPETSSVCRQLGYVGGTTGP